MSFSRSSKVSRRSFLRMTSMTAAGAVLVACSPAAAPGTGSGDEAGAAPDGERTTVRFHARIGAQEDALYEQQMPKYMEENPEIEIVKESFPGAEFPAKISTMQAGGTLGDVTWSALGGASIQFAYAQNIVTPIDDLVESEGVDLSQWYEGCLNGITVEGNLLGIPFKAHPGNAIVYYNITALDEAGLDHPQPGWTQSEQVEIAKALTEAEGDRTNFFGYMPQTTWKSFVTLMRAYGDELINEDGTQFQLNTETGIEAVKFMWDFYQTHKTSPTPEQMVGDPAQMWASGTARMFQAGTWASNLGNAIEDRFEWMVVPNAVGPGGVGGSDYEVDAYCVTTATSVPSEAFDWVQYLCNQESGELLGIIGGTIGGRPDVYGSEVLLENEYRQVFKDIMDNAQASRITANWRQTEAQTAFDQLTQPLWVGDVEPTEDVIADISSQIQDIMDKPKP